MQDPLSSVPHQTFQAHRASQLAPPHPSLPANPNKNPSSSSTAANLSLPAKPTAAAAMAAASVFAAPELRDLKKEATSFVPSAVKRRKATATDAISKVNAAPALNSAAPSIGDDVATEAELARPDLVGSLKVQFGTIPAPQVTKSKSDYDKFVEEMGDILGTK
jgi:hypothetical protein